MNKYLAALKDENSPDPNTCELPKLPKAPYGSFDSARVSTAQENQPEESPANAPIDVPDTPVRRWRVKYPHLPAIEVLMVPAATHADVIAIYRGAAIEPLPELSHRLATTAEAEELAMLIARVLADAPDEVGEVYRIACADPEAALTSFRALAAHLDLVAPDDAPTTQAATATSAQEAP